MSITLEDYRYITTNNYTEEQLVSMFIKYRTDQKKYDYIFTVLYKTYWNMLSGIYSSQYEERYGNHSKTEIIQDTLLKCLYLGTKNFVDDKDSSLSAWLTSCFHNAVRDQNSLHRNQYTNPLDCLLGSTDVDLDGNVLEALYPEELVFEETPEQTLSSDQVEYILQEALDNMPDHYAQCWRLRTELGCSYKEIAVKLNISVIHARKNVQRGKQILLETLYGGGPCVTS